LNVKDELAGKRIKCPECGNIVDVPDRDRATAFYKAGLKHQQSGDSAKAIAAFTAAIKLNADGAEYYHARGVVHLERKDHDAALDDFDAAARLNPKSAESCFQRGWAYWSKSELAPAVHSVSEAIRLDPQQAKYWLARGQLRRQLLEFEEAAEDLTESIRLHPTLEAYRSRAAVYGALGEDDQAAEDRRAADAIEQHARDSAYAEVFGAIKDHWREAAMQWWRGYAKDAAVCDHGMEDLARDAGYLKGGDYLLCEDCANTILQSAAETSKAVFDAAITQQIPRSRVVVFLAARDSQLRAFLGRSP